MKVTVEGNEIVIRAQIAKRASKSGKNIIVATSGGNLTTAAVVDGKPVVVGLNCYIKP